MLGRYKKWLTNPIGYQPKYVPTQPLEGKSQKTKGIRNPKWLAKQRTLGLKNPHSKNSRRFYQLYGVAKNDLSSLSFCCSKFMNSTISMPQF